MNYYRQSIAVFGFVLPTLVATAVVGAILLVSGKVTDSFDSNRSQYSSFQNERKACLALETQIARRRPHLERWASLLKEETSSTVTSQLKQVGRGIDPKEFQQTSFSRPNNSTGFGAACSQRSAPVQLSFRSTFRSMERVFVTIETRMPQLQLDELRIDRTSQSNTLNFQVGYTAWEN